MNCSSTSASSASFGELPEIGAEREIVVDALVGEDLPSLGGQGNPARHPLVRRQPRDVLPVEVDPARPHGHQPGDAFEQRALARAVSAHDGNDLSGLHVDGGVADRHNRTIGEMNVLQLQHVRPLP